MIHKYKKTWTILLSFISLLCLTDSVKAQIGEQEYAKYWYHRHRLRTEFMVIGQGPECADGRGAAYGGNLGYSIPAHQTYTRDNNIKWADGTIDLGFYIAVLATEYKVLNDEGHETQNTLEELFLAIKAFERLDNFSPNRYDNNQDCQDDGYFLRDDIGKEIFSENPIFNKYKGADGFYKYNSDYRQSFWSLAKDVATITPDQLHSLLMGFALVKKCLGDVTYNGFHFKNEVMRHAEQTTFYLESRNWKVKDEDGKKNKYGGVFKSEGHAWITAKATGYISDSFQSKDFLNNITAASRTLMKGVIALQKSNWPLLDDFTVAHMAAGFAVGDPGNGHSGLDTEAFLKDIRKSKKWVRTFFLDGVYPDYDFYYLLWNFLRDKNADLTDSEDIAQKLKDAPCYGIQYRPYGLDTSHPYYLGEEGWRASNKWFRGYNRDGNGKDNNKSHGLDYMLAYNVFLLYYKDKVPLKVGNLPKMKPGAFKVDINTPTSLSQNLYVFNNVEISSEITVTKNIEILGKKAHLKPGFSFKASTASTSLRIIGGPRNACGDVLDEYGDLESMESGVLFQENMNRIDNSPVLASVKQEKENKEEVDTAPFTRKTNYKPIGQFLEEKGSLNANASSFDSTIENQEVFVYPNPTKEFVNINLPVLEVSSLIELIDREGRIQQSKVIPAGTSYVKLKFSNEVQSGIILLKVTTGQTVVTKKLIIE